MKILLVRFAWLKKAIREYRYENCVLNEAEDYRAILVMKKL